MIINVLNKENDAHRSFYPFQDSSPFFQPELPPLNFEHLLSTTDFYLPNPL